MTERADGQVTWSDLGLWSGKTCPEHSAATKVETSRQSLKRSSASQSRKPPILKYLKKAGTPGGATTMKWEDDGAWLGECMTRNTGESPNVAVVSRLSQILEETPQGKYSLSAKACQGILRRAERRGKDLPETLKAVLLMQSESGGGCDGGGKGALVQEDKSGTLGTGNDQTIFCLQGNGIDRADTAGCNGKGWSEDTSYTLNTIGRPAVCAGVNNHAIFCMATQQGGAELRTDDRSPTLTAAAGMSGNNQPVVCAGFKLGNSEQARSIAYQEDLATTLNAECGGNKPAVVSPAAMAFDTTQITSKQNGSIPDFGKPCHTLNASAHVPCAVLDMSHACDVIRDCGEVSPRLQARMGTGGNQMPLTYQMQGFGDYREGNVASSCKQRDFKDGTDLVCAIDCRNFCEGGETNGTLQAKESRGQSLNLNNTVRQNMVVRRLTPLECERLQGFPDHWTDIGEWYDSQTGEGYWVDSLGKRHKTADSPRYKALGNSIALPFWDFLAKRISAQYLRPVTMGSLFDGIGGFPLVFERHNGKGTARWASEIEEFPIAVTKLRFVEDVAE